MGKEHIIRTLRLERGEKQWELAQVVGVSQDTVSRWERGHQEPKSSELRKLAEHFNCTADDLVACAAG